MSGILGSVTNAANTVANQVSLTTAAAESKVASLLSPSGAIGSTVNDILTAANDIAVIENTANAALSTLISAINDPIQISFSQGQPYAGTFITTPTTTLIPIALDIASIASSALGLAAFTCEQIAALAARVEFAIETDLELAQAFAYLFNELANIKKLKFSISLDLDCLCGCEDVTEYSYPTTDDTIVYNIPSITSNPNQTNLTNFVSSISSSFPNTPGIEGIAASVWVDGLSISADGSGNTITGIPKNIDNGIYNDITNQAYALIPSITPVQIVDYSYQQNLLNVILALAIDNGLIATITELMASSMVTPVSYQVIKNRLGSVATRGDTALLTALIGILGVNNVPNAVSLTSTLVSSLNPSDVTMSTTNNGTTTNSSSSTKSTTGGVSGGTSLTAGNSSTSVSLGSVSSTTTGQTSSTVFYAGGVAISTNTNTKTLSAVIADVQAILTSLGLTITQVFSQSTCNSIFCSTSLLNVPMIKAANQLVLDSLLGTSVVEMAGMFA